LGYWLNKIILSVTVNRTTIRLKVRNLGLSGRRAYRGMLMNLTEKRPKRTETMLIEPMKRPMPNLGITSYHVDIFSPILSADLNDPENMDL